MFEFALGAKWLEVLQQLVPGLAEAAVIYDRSTPSSLGFLQVMTAAAPVIGVKLSATPVSSESDIEASIAAAGVGANRGLIVLPGSLMGVHRELITTLTARHRIPAVYGLRDNPAKGGLASYGVDSVELYRKAASYLDRILKGEKPGDLPVQGATRFELMINLRAAQALGLDLPPALLFGADELIE